jgi:hypothetical protein
MATRVLHASRVPGTLGSTPVMWVAPQTLHVRSRRAMPCELYQALMQRFAATVLRGSRWMGGYIVYQMD